MKKVNKIFRTFGEIDIDEKINDEKLLINHTREYMLYQEDIKHFDGKLDIVNKLINIEVEKMKRELEIELTQKLSLKNINVAFTFSSFIISASLLSVGFASSSIVFLTFGTLILALNCIHAISGVYNERQRRS